MFLFYIENTLYLIMVKELIEIGVHKRGSKRQLGIFLGFNEKYAGQRVNELIKSQGVNTNTLGKLLEAAGLKHFLEVAIAAEHKKIIKKYSEKTLYSL